MARGAFAPASDLFPFEHRPTSRVRITPHGEVPARRVACFRMKNPIIKISLLSVCVITLLATTGCLVSDGGRYHDHGGYGHRDEIIVGPPVLVVRPPVVIVR